jgi:hypothetical protein
MKIQPRPTPLRVPAKEASTPTNGASVQVIEGGMCDIDIVRGSVGLRWKTYRAPIERLQRKALIRTLKAQVGHISRITTPSGLGQLAYALHHLPVLISNFTFPAARIRINKSCRASVLLLLGSSRCCSE